MHVYVCTLRAVPYAARLRRGLLCYTHNACSDNAGSHLWLPPDCKVEVTEASGAHAQVVYRKPPRSALKGVPSQDVFQPFALRFAFFTSN